MLWTDVCRDSNYRGRWIALEGARYDSGLPVEGDIIDTDPDLGALVARIQSADHLACAIVFCDDKASGIRRAQA